jgi:hypothetical protein
MDLPSLIENGVSRKLNFGYLLVCLYFGDELSTSKLVVVDLTDFWKIIGMAVSLDEDHMWFEDRWMVASLCDE